MSGAMGRLDYVRVVDKRTCHKDGTWSGEFYYEWPCGCRIYIPVFRDGSLGSGYRDAPCRDHSIETVKEPDEGLDTFKRRTETLS